MENNKEELKKLESQYNKYMRIVKFILLIVLFIFLIFATRFIYIYSIMNNVVKAMVFDKTNKNIKVTYEYTFPDLENEQVTNYTYYKDGVIVNKYSEFFKSYIIDGKIYIFSENSENKTYSINDYDLGKRWEDLNLFEKIGIVCFHTTSYFTNNFSHEELDGKKCITTSNENSKKWYDAETFLLVKDENKNNVTNIKYEFDVVTDEDIKLPDLSEYVLKED